MSRHDTPSGIHQSAVGTRSGSRHGMPHGTHSRTAGARGARAMTLSIGLLYLTAMLLFLASCAATGGVAGTAKEALCAVHNSTEMKLLCETGGGR